MDTWLLHVIVISNTLWVLPLLLEDFVGKWSSTKLVSKISRGEGIVSETPLLGYARISKHAAVGYWSLYNYGKVPYLNTSKVEVYRKWSRCNGQWVWMNSLFF